MLSNLTKINQEDDQMDTHKDHYMKSEALNYLKKTLINKDYANYFYTLQIALKYGTQQWEIDNIVNKYTYNKKIELNINSLLERGVQNEKSKFYFRR